MNAKCENFIQELYEIFFFLCNFISIVHVKFLQCLDNILVNVLAAIVFQTDNYYTDEEINTISDLSSNINMIHT